MNFLKVSEFSFTFCPIREHHVIFTLNHATNNFARYPVFCRGSFPRAKFRPFTILNSFAIVPNFNSSK